MIVYDPHTERYAMIYHETIIGYAETRHEAEIELHDLDNYLVSHAFTTGFCEGHDVAGMKAFAAAYIEQEIRPCAQSRPIAPVYESFGTLDGCTIQGLRSRFTNKRLGVVAVESAEIDDWRLVADDSEYVSVTRNGHTILPPTRILDVATLRGFLKGDALLRLLVAVFAWTEGKATPPNKPVKWKNVHP